MLRSFLWRLGEYFSPDPPRRILRGRRLLSPAPEAVPTGQNHPGDAIGPAHRQNQHEEARRGDSSPLVLLNRLLPRRRLYTDLEQAEDTTAGAAASPSAERSDDSGDGTSADWTRSSTDTIAPVPSPNVHEDSDLQPRKRRRLRRSIRLDEETSPNCDADDENQDGICPTCAKRRSDKAGRAHGRSENVVDATDSTCGAEDDGPAVKKPPTDAPSERVRLRTRMQTACSKYSKTPHLHTLPDGVLIRIFDTLSGTPETGALCGRSLKQGREAHALAQTCYRLYQLFRSACCRKIVFDYSDEVVVSASRGGRHERQLVGLCRFAGVHLQRLTISGCYEGNFSQLYSTLLKSCPNLDKLEIHDSDYEFSFCSSLLELLTSRQWHTLHLPMAMRCTNWEHLFPSPSEPSAPFLMDLVHSFTKHCREMRSLGKPLRYLAIPTRPPSCDSASIFRLWQSLPDLHGLRLSADLPEFMLKWMQFTFHELRELRLNLVARISTTDAPRSRIANGRYLTMFEGIGSRLEVLELGYFDLDKEFAADVMRHCNKLQRLYLRSCRYLTVETLKLFSPVLYELVESDLPAPVIAALPQYGKNLRALDVIPDPDFAEPNVSTPLMQWAREIRQMRHLEHLRIRGSENGLVVTWDLVLVTLAERLANKSAPGSDQPLPPSPKLRTLRVERVNDLTRDTWIQLMRATGHSLTTISAYGSEPLSMLQFIISVSDFCPRAERIRLPRLWETTRGDGDLFDVIAELMRLEQTAPHCAVAALRRYADFIFTFERRGGLEWVGDEPL